MKSTIITLITIFLAIVPQLFSSSQVNNTSLLSSFNDFAIPIDGEGETRSYMQNKIIKGNLAISKGLYVDAMEYFTVALKLAHDSNDSLYTGIANSYIGFTLAHVGNYQDGLNYAKESHQYIGNSSDAKIRLWCNVCLGSLFYLNQNRTDAQQILVEAISEAETLNMHTPFMIYAYTNLASIKIIENKLDEAQYLLEKAIEDPNNQYKRVLITCYYKLGRIHRCQGESIIASNYFDKALELAKKENDKTLVASLYVVFAKKYQAEGNFELSTKYFSLADSLSTNVIDSKVSQKVQQVALNYQKDIELKRVELTKRQAEIDKLILLEKSSRQKSILFLLLFIVAGILALLLFQKRKNTQKISILKYEVAKSKELLLQNYISGQEEERNRIARDLHDGIGSQMAVLKMRLARIQNGTESKNGAFENTILLCDEIYNGLREVAFNLMPRPLVREGLVSALQELTNKLIKNSNIKFCFNNYGLTERLPLDHESALFRIVQEITANIVKHSKATIAAIDLSSDENVTGLTISWNGRGFNPRTFENSKGFGWKNINTRLSQVGGSIIIDTSEKSNSSVIMVEIPHKITQNYGKAG